MRKSFLIALIFSITLLLFYFIKLTFFAPIILQVFSKKIFGISLFLPTEVFKEETFKAIIGCKNYGNLEISNVYTEIFILDQNLTSVIYSESRMENLTSLKPLEEKVDEYYITITQAGDFFVVSRCYYEDKYEEKNSTIKVKEKIPLPVPAPAPPVLITLPPPPAPFYKIKIEYPEEINVTQGDVISFYVKIINIGSPIKNLRLGFEEVEGIKMFVLPSEILILESNSSALFIVTLNVSYELKEGTYFLTFHFRSDKIEEDFKIKLNVFKSLIKEKVENLISFYKDLLKKIAEEIANLELKGKDMSQAKYFAEEASKHLLTAEKLYKFHLFEDSLKELEEVRKYVVKAIIEIVDKSIEKIPKVVAVLPFIDWRIIVISILVSLLIFLIVKLIKRIKEEIEKRRMIEIYSIKLRRIRI